MKKVDIIIFIVILLLSNCENFNMDERHSIQVKNKSNQIIFVYAAYQSPDTLLSIDKPSFLTVQPMKYDYLKDSDVGDPEFKKLSRQKLTIFFLSKDSIDKYTWDSIKNSYKILERREILESDLGDNGSIEFPI